MYKEYGITVTIESEAIFGSGKSNGLIHEDGKYDEDGFMYYSGKTLKGMFKKTSEMIKQIANDEESTNIIDSFFSDKDNNTILLHFSDLKFSSDTREKLSKYYSKNDVLKATTNIRNNITIENGITKLNSLRATRTLKTGMELHSTITVVQGELNKKEESLLKLIVENTRYLGKSITKGRGLVTIKIDGIDKNLEECYEEVFNEDKKN